MSGLLDLADAQRRLLAMARPGPIIELPASAALGHFLANNIDARRTQPERPLSAMDGWAVRQADMPGPWRIVGESAAGHPCETAVAAGQAVRISTGAVLPDGSDMVLVQEQCTAQGGVLNFAGDPPTPPKRHIRRRGLDFSAGDVVLQAGERLGPATLALAISAGHAVLPVHNRPRIAIIDSGDELVPPGIPLGPGQIPASNGMMLAAMLAAYPCEISQSGPVPDRIDAIMAALSDASDADLVITTGGASVGDHDLVMPAMEAIGATLHFWRVAIKPGKPIMVARRGEQILLGLPGNPVSAFVTATMFALPFVKAMLGARDPFPPREPAISVSALPATGKRAEFLRATLSYGRVEILKTQDSGALAPLASAQALICREAHAEPVSPGQTVEIIRIRD
ncbi:molybdopterin molybdenumtransferase MoeA [Croceicoccus ponticola]|uniref:Molybdopterin molybdenumtransferase n=1 Tax=Croceicoccus ponticola TaxID=2217664 RepID=A0A437H0B7_9SPHN|nr:gephyrin-like molybdotransferase Glp [Croceicoccus ponticola]RVQ69064.1 molybdopterin molybdenumtransferase MoeA [Croceicoccus ponticola]